MKTTFAILILLCVTHANATSIRFRDLTNMVMSADHVLIGKVTRVDMVDGKGQPVIDETARSRPGTNGAVIRLHVEVAKDGILATTTNQVPEKLVIREWEMWVQTLGGYGKTFLQRRVNRQSWVLCVIDYI